MWAFIPASANWIGATSRRPRASNSGAHAWGTGPPEAAASTAAKYRSANATSSRERKAGSSKPSATAWAATAIVTAR